MKSFFIILFLFLTCLLSSDEIYATGTETETETKEVDSEESPEALLALCQESREQYLSLFQNSGMPGLDELRGPLCEGEAEQIEEATNFYQEKLASTNETTNKANSPVGVSCSTMNFRNRLAPQTLTPSLSINQVYENKNIQSAACQKYSFVVRCESSGLCPINHWGEVIRIQGLSAVTSSNLNYALYDNMNLLLTGPAKPDARFSIDVCLVQPYCQLEDQNTINASNVQSFQLPKSKVVNLTSSKFKYVTRQVDPLSENITQMSLAKKVSKSFGCYGVKDPQTVFGNVGIRGDFLVSYDSRQTRACAFPFDAVQASSQAQCCQGLVYSADLKKCVAPLALFSKKLETEIQIKERTTFNYTNNCNKNHDDFNRNQLKMIALNDELEVFQEMVIKKLDPSKIKSDEYFLKLLVDEMPKRKESYKTSFEALKNKVMAVEAAVKASAEADKIQDHQAFNESSLKIYESQHEYLLKILALYQNDLVYFNKVLSTALSESWVCQHQLKCPSVDFSNIKKDAVSGKSFYRKHDIDEKTLDSLVFERIAYFPSATPHEGNENNVKNIPNAASLAKEFASMMLEYKSFEEFSCPRYSLSEFDTNPTLKTVAKNQGLVGRVELVARMISNLHFIINHLKAYTNGQTMHAILAAKKPDCTYDGNYSHDGKALGEGDSYSDRDGNGNNSFNNGLNPAAESGADRARNSAGAVNIGGALSSGAVSGSGSELSIQGGGNLSGGNLESFTGANGQMAYSETGASAEEKSKATALEGPEKANEAAAATNTNNAATNTANTTLANGQVKSYENSSMTDKVAGKIDPSTPATNNSHNVPKESSNGTGTGMGMGNFVMPKIPTSSSYGGRETAAVNNGNNNNTNQNIPNLTAQEKKELAQREADGLFEIISKRYHLSGFERLLKRKQAVE